MNTPYMTSWIGQLLGAALLLFCVEPTAWAQGKIDAQLMLRHGGVRC